MNEFLNSSCISASWHRPSHLELHEDDSLGFRTQAKDVTFNVQYIRGPQNKHKILHQNFQNSKNDLSVNFVPGTHISKRNKTSTPAGQVTMRLPVTLE